MAKERSLYEYSKIFDDLGYKYFFDIGSHSWLGRIASLGEMEKVFRDLNHCVGAVTPEIFFYIYREEADRSMMDGAMELCRKYGKKFLMADMNWKWAKWQNFNNIYYDIFQDRQYADYYIPQFKTTNPTGTNIAISALQGMKLSGMVKDIGMWSDFWTWEKFGQVNEFDLKNWLNGTHHNLKNEQKYPFIQNIKNYIYGITYGSTTFGLESNLQWHWRTAIPNDHFYRYLEPFISAVVQEGLIPPESAINKNFKVIVDSEVVQRGNGTSGTTLTYVNGNIWGDFIRSTYGITQEAPYNAPITSANEPAIYAVYNEMFPNSDRYPSGIPMIPKSSLAAPVINGNRLEKIKISDLNTKAKVNAKLNKYYPETGNQAYARKIGQSIFAFNTYENHDIKQNYSVGINCAGIESMSGQLALLNYVVGKCRSNGKSIFFQTNGYVKGNTNLVGARYNLPTYNTVVQFKCLARPGLTSNEMGAISQSWNANTKVLTVTVNHRSAGAVNFILSGESQGNPTDQIVSLKGNNGKYVSSENGVAPMICNKTDARAYEKFIWVDLGDGKIALKGNNGKYVSAENGMTPMQCNKTTIGATEKFIAENLGNNVYAFKGNNGKYVSSENGVTPMKCNRNAIGPWERFVVNFDPPMSVISHIDNGQSVTETKQQYTIYPNPATGVLKIVTGREDNKGVTIEIIRADGSHVLERSLPANTESTIDISAWPAGIYLIKSDGHASKRLVVQ